MLCHGLRPNKRKLISQISMSLRYTALSTDGATSRTWVISKVSYHFLDIFVSNLYVDKPMGHIDRYAKPKNGCCDYQIPRQRDRDASSRKPGRPSIHRPTVFATSTQHVKCKFLSYALNETEHWQTVYSKWTGLLRPSYVMPVFSPTSYMYSLAWHKTKQNLLL